MKCALFGFGKSGNIHYTNILNNKELELKYIYDIFPISIKLYTNNYKIKITDNLDIVLNDKEIELVIISNSILNNYNLILKLFENNKNILLDNILFTNEDQINNICSKAKEKNLVFLNTINKRFDPNFINIKKDIENNKIEEIYQINIVRSELIYKNTNSKKKINESIIYDIDLINWILNDYPTCISIIKNKERIQNNNLIIKENNLEISENYKVNIEYSKGTKAIINYLGIFKNYYQSIEINGKDYHNILKIKKTFLKEYSILYSKVLENMIDLIKNKKKFKVNIKDIINSFRILKACKESYKNQNKVIIKNLKNFRDYNNVEEVVKNTYKLGRQNQTLEFVKNMHKKYLTFKRKMSLDEIFHKLESFIDISDPDISLPNYYHGIQTAEGIRKDGYPDWFQLVGLIHDIGKIIYLWGCDKDGTSLDTQWGIVGDTFILGCKLPKNIVYPEFNDLNADSKNSLYNNELGIYKESCGLDNVYCSWGHDEYLYQILKYNRCSLPEEALYIIRFHSLYSYHKYNEYQLLTNEKDKKMLKWLKLFNKYDLYTKNNNIEYNENIKNYYKNIIQKYINNSELWV